jgi:hypothetical protein
VSLLDVLSVRREVLVFDDFVLLFEIARTHNHIFTPDTIQLILERLFAICQKYPQSLRLYSLFDRFFEVFKPQIIPIHTVVAFFLTVVKSQKAKARHPIAISTLARTFEMSKEVTVRASFILDAEPSPQSVTLRRTLSKPVCSIVAHCRSLRFAPFREQAGDV